MAGSMRTCHRLTDGADYIGPEAGPKSIFCQFSHNHIGGYLVVKDHLQYHNMQYPAYNVGLQSGQSHGHHNVDPFLILLLESTLNPFAFQIDRSSGLGAMSKLYNRWYCVSIYLHNADVYPSYPIKNSLRLP